MVAATAGYLLLRELMRLACDEFREEDVKRDKGGKFSATGGGGGSSSAGGGSEKEAEAGGSGGSTSGKIIPPAQAEQIQKEWKEKSSCKTVEAALEYAPKNQQMLAGILRAAAEHFNLHFQDPGVKGEKRIREKIEEGKRPQDITDIVRGGLNVDDPGNADAIVEKLAEKFEVADQGWWKTEEGYFDRKAIVRFPDGQVGEVQFWPPGMLDAKEKQGGHKLYEEFRSLPPNHPPDMPPEVVKKKVDLADKMRTLYSDVQKKLSEQWKPIFAPG
jgi:hypothetical protein